MSTITQFSTEDIPAGRRSILFRRRMEDLFSLGLEVAPAVDEPLRTKVLAYSGRQLQFAALRFSPHTTGPRRVNRSSTQRLLLSVNKEGQTYVAQDGRESWIGGNEIFLIDPDRPFYIESGHILTYSVYLPATQLRSAIPHVDLFTARAIDGARGAGAVLRAIVDELCEHALTLSDGEADGVADLLPHAIAPALLSVERSMETTGSRLRSLHKHRIKRFARENLSDPALDVAAIAANVQLSARYIYELFSDEPHPLMKWIWLERLERCRRELSVPELRGRSIGEIAYSWGFTNVAHFSRAFRGRYGAAPRDLRRHGAPAPQLMTH